MTSKKKKIFKVLLIIIATLLNLFIVVFTPCYTELIANKKSSTFSFEIVLIVLLPFLASIIVILLSDRFSIFTKDDALRQLENQFNKGLIDMEHFKEQYKHIEMFEIEKRKLKAIIDIEKIKLEDTIKEEAKKIVNETKENNI